MPHRTLWIANLFGITRFKELVSMSIVKERVVYNSHGADSELNIRNGMSVQVIGELDENEYDVEETGLMYRVRFDDGFETDVFSDELELHLVVPYGL